MPGPRPKLLCTPTKWGTDMQLLAEPTRARLAFRDLALQHIRTARVMRKAASQVLVLDARKALRRMELKMVQEAKGLRICAQHLKEVR